MDAKQLSSDNALLAALDRSSIKAALDAAPSGVAWNAFAAADQQNGTKSSHSLQKSSVPRRALLGRSTLAGADAAKRQPA